MHQQMQRGDFSFGFYNRKTLLARPDSVPGINREAVFASPQFLMALTRNASPIQHSQ